MLGAILKGLEDIIYPRLCLACKQRIGSASKNELVCRPCWETIRKNLPPFCHYCGRHLNAKHTAKNVCPLCLKRIPRFDRAFSVCVYEGAIKELIQAFKYKNKDYLGKTLSRLMIDYIKEYEVSMDVIDFIAPIPLHSLRLREREFNQAAILARQIALEFNKAVLEENLIRHRLTKTQTDLSPANRIINVKDSFSLKNGRMVAGKNLLLIDDVFTTGATASEAAAALKNRGANIVFVLTLAS